MDPTRRARPLDRALPWAVRAGWVVVPFACGPALAAALDPRSAGVRTAAAVVLWAGWAAVLVATLVAHPVSLTVTRVGAPAALAASVAAAVSGRAPHAGPLAVAWSALVCVLCFAPGFGLHCVNGPAYPNERRYPLRPPGPLLLGPLELAWAVVVGGPIAGVLLLAARRWVLGAVMLAVAAPAAVVLARAVHGLSRRWLVFVPAGVVLHDPLVLLDPVLFERRVVEALHPARVGTDSLDLTMGAPGLVLELVLTDKVPMTLSRPGRRLGEAGSSARLLVCPTRPGAVLVEAAGRRLAVR